MGTGMLAHKLLSGNWKLFLGSQLPFYFHFCVWEDEIPGQGGSPTGAAAGGTGSPAAQGLSSCWCSADSEERDASQRCGNLWQSYVLALELGSFARIWVARVNLWEAGNTVCPESSLFYFRVGFFSPRWSRFFSQDGCHLVFANASLVTEKRLEQKLGFGREGGGGGGGVYFSGLLLLSFLCPCLTLRFWSKPGLHQWGDLGRLLSFIFAKSSLLHSLSFWEPWAG